VASKAKVWGTTMTFQTQRLRLFIGCILGIGIVLLFTSSVYVWGQEPEDRPVVSLDVILLIDNSWSMSNKDLKTGAPPGDPDELRIRASQFLVDYLRVNAEVLGANYRVGAISFGGTVGKVIPLHLLQDDVVRDSIQAEVILLTDFQAPLERTLEELRAESFGAENKMAAILLTDGRPDRAGDPMTEEELHAYFEEDLTPLTDELQEEGVSLFVLGIGDAQKDKDNWIQLIPEEHYISIDNTTELADVYHDIVADLIGINVSEGESLPTGEMMSIEVEPYLEHIVFSFMKSDPIIRVTLISSSRDVLTPTIGGTDDAYAIYSIPNPDVGEWEVLKVGEGEVQYWVEKQEPHVQITSTSSSLVAGRPMTVTASLLQNGIVIADAGLDFEAEIILPDGDTVTWTLQYVGNGQYSTSSQDARIEGAYTVTARVSLGDQGLVVSSRPVSVDVSPVPPAPTFTPTVVPTSTPAPMATPTSTPTSTPTATPQRRESVSGFEVGHLVAVLVLILSGLLLLFWALRRHSQPTSPLEEEGEKVEELIEEAEQRDEIDQQVIVMILSSFTLVTEYYLKILERAMNNLRRKPGGLAGIIEIVNETHQDIEPVMMRYGLVEVLVPDWSNPNKTERTSEEIEQMLVQIDDPQKVAQIFEKMRMYDEIPQNIRNCLSFYIGALGQRVDWNILLNGALLSDSVHGNLVGLGECGAIGREWLTVYETFKNCWNASSFQEAADSIRLDQLQGLVFGGTQFIFSTIKEARNSQPGSPMRGSIRNQIQGLHEPHKSILKAVFIQRDWV
jgi:hypothetical protein